MRSVSLPIQKTWTSLVLAIVMFHSVVFSAVAQAGMISTQDALAIQQHEISKQELLSALELDQVQQQLLAMGVDADIMKDRVAMMTAEEIREANQALADMPAGQSVLGLAVLVFLVFVVTDMMCATDLFTFVNCINK